MLLSDSSFAESYYFKECKLSNAVSADYVINIDKNVIQVNLRSLDGATQNFSDKIKTIEKNKIISICFPRGIKEKYKQFNNIVKPDGLNIDYDLNPEWAKSHLKNVVLQGGLNPKALLEPDKKMFEEATKYIKTFNDIPYIFNLGHGLLPETDPDKLKKLINFYRKY